MHTVITEQFRKTVLHDALKIFKSNGVHSLSENDLIKKLGISPVTFHHIADGKEDMFKKAVINDMEEQRARNEEIMTRISNPLEQLMTMLKKSLNDSKDLNPSYISDFLTFPELWPLIEKEMQEYSTPMYQKLLNSGIREGIFRKDINIDIVTKVIMQNIHVALNLQVFPPERYNIGEVTRCIYLYYFRGLCEPESARLVDNYFA